jgi:integrase/recombinase XerD
MNSKTEFSQNISLKIVMRDHVLTDGTNTLYLRVTIDRKKKDISLKRNWPKSFFDPVRQIALPRHNKDQDVTAVNMVVEEAKGRGNRIKLRYFTEGRRLTLETFAKELDTYESRDNFLFYWKEKMNANYNSGIISKATHTQHQTNYNRLNEYIGGNEFMSMGAINSDFVQRYESWLLKSKKLAHNSKVKALKVMNTYYLAAKEDGYKFNDKAFKKAKTRYMPGERCVLEQEELKRLRKLFSKETLPETAQEVLRKFLFSCYTGLRISDSAAIHTNMINQGKITVKMKKGERFGKEVTIKLTEYALKLIKGRKGLLFDTITDQVCNRWLKMIAGATEPPIDKELTFHVSRDTYATMFVELGGDVGTLKELMGHSSIATTQIYIKMGEKRKDMLMDNFNKLDEHDHDE